MIEISCFNFEWRYIKSEFLADHKHAEFGTRDFIGKNLQRNLQLIFIKKMSQCLAETHKKSFCWKNAFFPTFSSHKIACELTGQTLEWNAFFTNANVMFWEDEISCKTCITSSHETNTKLTI